MKTRSFLKYPVATVLLAAVMIASGCASYTTPGAGVNVQKLSQAPEDIAETMKREPTAGFPSRISVVRAQSSGYYAYGSEPCFGRGRYCLVTARDGAELDAIDRIGRLPMIAGVAPIGRLLLPEQLDSIKDIRLAAAQVKTDMLLLYTLETRFRIEDRELGPLSVISLGFAPSKKASVTTTASSALFDVRTGFVYGVAEASATDSQSASMWSTEKAVDKVRLKTEADAFNKMVGEFEKLWKGVVETHVASTAKP